MRAAITTQLETKAWPGLPQWRQRGMLATASTLTTTTTAAHGQRSKFAVAPGTSASVYIVVSM